MNGVPRVKLRHLLGVSITGVRTTPSPKRRPSAVNCLLSVCEQLTTGLHLLDGIAPVWRPSDCDQSAWFVKWVVYEVNAILTSVESYGITRLGVEPIVGNLHTTTTHCYMEEFLLILVIVEMVLGETFTWFENCDVQIEVVNSQFR